MKFFVMYFQCKLEIYCLADHGNLTGGVMYDGYLNRYSFVKDGRKTTLVPLSSANTFADQLKLEERKKELDKKELKRKTRVE